jgi:hypothetical protein
MIIPAKNTDAAKALTYVPVILSQLDETGKDMLAKVFQALIEAGYADGFEDCREYLKGRKS